MNSSSIKETSTYEPPTATINDDFFGFLTCDHITLKMLKRAHKCAKNQSKILWIEGEAGTGKHLFAQSIATQYSEIQKCSLIGQKIKISHNQINDINISEKNGSLTISIMQDCTKDCLIKLQQQLVDIMQTDYDKFSLITIISYPSNQYSISVNKQLANMRNVLINEQYEYMMLQPLRNRHKDINLLSANYIEKFSQILNVPLEMKLNEIIEENLDILIAHKWHYNVKELQQYCLLISQMIGFCKPTRELLIHGLEIIGGKQAQLKNQHLCLINNQADKSRNFANDTNISMLESNGTMKQFADLEYEIISKACRYYRGSKTVAAKELGLGRTTLYRKLNKEFIEYN